MSSSCFDNLDTLPPELKLIIQYKEANDDIRNILEDPASFILQHLPKLAREFGGKGACLYALKHLGAYLDYKVPQFECIPVQTLGKKYYGVENFEFDEEDLKCLKLLFSRFQSPFLAVRSSGEHEDGDERNYSGAFYTGFCKGDNFAQFCQEVKKVILSGRSVNPPALMGIVVMEIKGDFDQNELFAPDAGGVMATTNFGDQITISAEFGMPVGITSGDGHAITIDFDKEGKPLHVIVDEYNSLQYDDIQGKAMITKDGLIQYSTGHNLIPKKISPGVSGIFSKEIYDKLIFIGKLLEKIWKSPLDIEFVVHNSQIYLIQARKYPNNYTRPERMTSPNLEPHQMIICEDMMLSSCGFLNNEKLINKNLSLCDKRGNCADRRRYDKSAILEVLQQLEIQYQGKKYMLGIDRLEVFPEIDIQDFPGLALVYFPDTESNHQLSHAYMLLREYRIPHIICSYMGYYNLLDTTDSEVLVYLDGNKKGIIYAKADQDYQEGEEKYMEIY